MATGERAARDERELARGFEMAVAGLALGIEAQLHGMLQQDKDGDALEVRRTDAGRQRQVVELADPAGQFPAFLRCTFEVVDRRQPGRDLEALARKAYLAYGATTDFKNYQELPMPEWEALPEKIQAAWKAAAGALVPE